jgi:N-acetylglucosamine-6-phosphate deacetylase
VASRLIHSTSIVHGGVLHENAWALLREEGTVTGVGDEWKKHSADEVTDGTGTLLHAGLFDTHCHGGAGFAANRGLRDIRGILDFNEEHHVTRTIVSLVSADVSEMVDIALATRELAEDPRFVGLHFEGPFLSHEYKGAHDPQALKKPTDGEIASIAGAGTVQSITLAPEMVSRSQMELLVSAGVTLCFGHSGAEYEQARDFFGHFPHSVMTHTFNGMRGIHHRAPGPVLAAKESGAFMELIADGIHVLPPAALLIPQDRLILVTDASEATGQPDGSYALGGVDIAVSRGVATTWDGSLAGSTLLLKDAVKNYASWSGDPLAAINAATTNPERAYGHKPNTLSAGNAFLLEL